MNQSRCHYINGHTGPVLVLLLDSCASSGILMRHYGLLAEQLAEQLAELLAEQLAGQLAEQL